MATTPYLIFLICIIPNRVCQEIFSDFDMTCQKCSSCKHELESLADIVRNQELLIQTMRNEFNERISKLEQTNNNTGCVDPWTEFDSNCYFFSHVQKSWNESSNYCKQEEAHLAIINSERENDYIKQMAKTNNVNLWLDGSDSANEGTWIWTTSGEPLTFKDWRPGDPDGGNSQNCLVSHKAYSYQWIDDDCPDLWNFVCEKE